LPGHILLRLGTWRPEAKAVVVIAYRLVDTETTEIIAAGQVRGESERKARSWDGLLANAGEAWHGPVSMQSSGFTESIIGEAVVDCVDKLAGILTESESKLAARKVEVAARVADVSGSTITINAGSNQGLQPGQQLAVARVVYVDPDPATRTVMDLRTQPIGTLVITEVGERIAIGTFTGSMPPKPNDFVLSISPNRSR
jgi:hypothetical protein